MSNLMLRNYFDGKHASKVVVVVVVVVVVAVLKSCRIHAFVPGVYFEQFVQDLQYRH